MTVNLQYLGICAAEPAAATAQIGGNRERAL
jgi:hypothetical protein